jgi:5-methyltetrahydrofolate--homocysteine methyltransferase
VNRRQKILQRIRRGVLILDGATGTELQARGMPQGVSPEVYALNNPGAIKEVHRGYLGAGADVLYSCTFGANRFKLAQYGVSDAHDMNRRLAALARDACGATGLVAGISVPTVVSWSRSATWGSRRRWHATGSRCRDSWRAAWTSSSSRP